MTRDLSLAIQAAQKAGELIRKNYRKAQTITSKNPNNFVTETDIEAEKIIVSILKETGYCIFGEETGKTDTNEKKQWVIDPLDGTNNFIRGIPFFAISIAVIENNSELILGVVYDPFANECYWAEANSGAYMNNKKIHISNRKDINNALIIIDHGWSKKSKDEYVYALKNIIQNDGAAVIRYGGTALSLCYMAKGSVDAFLSCGDELYDYAAGLLIAKEAGATISDWNGKLWDNTNSYILATNQHLRDEILKRMTQLQ